MCMSHLIFIAAFQKVGTHIILIYFQMRTMKPREVEYLAQGHTAKFWLTVLSHSSQFDYVTP